MSIKGCLFKETGYIFFNILAQNNSREAKRGLGDTNQAGIRRVNLEVIIFPICLQFKKPMAIYLKAYNYYLNFGYGLHINYVTQRVRGLELAIQHD